MNPSCPACTAKRIHTKPEWDEFHPATSTDFSAEHGTPKPKEEVKIDKS